MRPRILQIGSVIDLPDGSVKVSHWHFDTSNLPEDQRRELTAEQMLECLMKGYIEVDDAGEMWSVDELRAIQYQALEIGLL